MSISDTTRHPSAYHLRPLVLDYLTHQCYTNTARAFLRDSAVKHFNADGDEVELPLSSTVDTGLRSVAFTDADLRDEIRTCILSGRIDDAVELLNEHFPRVLSREEVRRDKDDITNRHPLQDTLYTTSNDYIAPHSLDPAHLSLNLRIQAFIEVCRTVPLVYKRTPVRDISGPAETPSASGDRHEVVRDDATLLSRAQKLYALVDMLPNPSDREQYGRELRNVAGLLVYKVPEVSASSKYMSQERRDAVAAQIDSAILHASGKPVISTLELVARHVSITWTCAHELGVTIQAGAPLPPTKDPGAVQGKKGNNSEIVPPFDLGLFLDEKSPVKDN
ncbi:hypothetical protein APHAL10511_001104 [Amanita phalloides]|nr:hypothetical protein APHAL10511_001104 [Amanita phalloides]